MTAPALPGRLKGKGFKATVDGEEKVDDKSAAVLKVVGPDGKDFRLFFDKESGLPVKLVARVVGWRRRGVRAGDGVHRLQGLRRLQAARQGRQQARRRAFRRAVRRRLQS